MRSLSSVLFLTAAALPLSAQWNQYLGPTGDSVSTETGLLDAWPEGGPKELWRIETGPGFGGAAIVDGQVFILDREHSAADVLRVLDLETGKEQWRYRYEAAGRVGYEGSRCTPAVTDTHIFTTGELGHLYAFDRATKKVAWSVNLLEAFPDADNSEGLNWGYGMNPLTVGELVVVASPAKETPGLIAFNQKTGEKVWESEPFGDSNMYSSPILRSVLGKTGIIVRTVKEIYFIDPKTGGTLFEHACYDKGKIPITPVTVMPDGQHIFVTQGYEMGSVMLKVEKTAAKPFVVSEVYRTVRGSQIHPGIAIGEHLYINHTENDTSRGSTRKLSGLACVEPKTGKVVWNTGEEPFIGRGGSLYVEGKLIVQDAEGGKLYLVQPSPAGFKPISSFQATETKQRQAWAPLSLGDGRLIVRDQDEMVCFDLRKK